LMRGKSEHRNITLLPKDCSYYRNLMACHPYTILFNAGYSTLYMKVKLLYLASCTFYHHNKFS
jgi:hypothetical protein